MDEASTQRPAPRRGSAWLIISQTAIVAFILALVLYFQYQEGLVHLPFLEPLLGAPIHPRAYATILSNVPGSYRIWWDNIPWGGLAWATGALALVTLLGWFVLDAFELYVPRVAKVVLSLAIGTGVAGVALELLTMAHLLHRWPVVALWILMLATAALYWRKSVLRSAPIAEQTGGAFARKIRAEQAREWMDVSIRNPTPGLERVYFFAAAALIAIISLLVLLHAIALPETYWDSLILYMGYARKMFLERGFPEKVVGQVGIGLGANYPHLFPLLSAQTAAVAGYWDDMFAQLMPPVFGLCATLLVYYIALEMTQEKIAAITVALLFRAIPYGIIYHQYASDYALAIFYTTAFLYFALRYCKDGLTEYRTLMLLMAAFAVHINYLMWCLWIVAGAVMMFAHARRRRPDEQTFVAGAVGEEVRPLRPPWFMQTRGWTPLISALRSRRFILPALLALAIASPWYIRNVIVTGNPVYAFFYNIFPSKNVNPEVMRSAEIEWLNNGDGLGRVGHTLPEKLRNSWAYFVTSSLHWRLSPVLVAFGVLGFLLQVALLNRRWSAALRLALGSGRFIAACTVLWAILWFYAYVVADFYLYQIIIVLPLVAIFSVLVLQLCSSRFARVTLLMLALLIGFSPGVIVGLMGFKLKKSGIYGGQVFSQIDLTPLKNLFMEKHAFYTMEFGGDMLMFDRLRSIPTGRKILTHENRHLLLDERLKIVHLDDWEVQKAYRKPLEERLRILRDLGINYYLYVPNEDNHRANSWLGMDELIGAGHFKEQFRTRSSGSSNREGLDYKNIPPGYNILYRAAADMQ